MSQELIMNRFKFENMIVVGFSVGSVKPKMQEFLSILVDKLLKLEVEGFKYHERHYQVRLLAGAFDKPAFASVMNWVGHNKLNKENDDGANCPRCQIPRDRESGCTIYAWNEEYSGLTNLKTDEAVREALHTGELLEFMKGPTQIARLEHVDLVNFSTICMMHQVDGVMKQLMRMYFLIHNERKWSLKKRVRDQLRANLENFIVPHDLSRKYRDIEVNFLTWKFVEFEHLLKYGVPLFEGILPKAHYKNLKQFSNFAYTVSSKIGFDREEVPKLQECIGEFVQEFQVLFGRKYMTSNLHTLLHLPQNLEACGPT